MQHFHSSLIHELCFPKGPHPLFHLQCNLPCRQSKTIYTYFCCLHDINVTFSQLSNLIPSWPPMAISKEVEQSQTGRSTKRDSNDNTHVDHELYWFVFIWHLHLSTGDRRRAKRSKRTRVKMVIVKLTLFECSACTMTLTQYINTLLRPMALFPSTFPNNAVHVFSRRCPSLMDYCKANVQCDGPSITFTWAQSDLVTSHLAADGFNRWWQMMAFVAWCSTSFLFL